MTGRLIYLMGPSGSGKDSLLHAASDVLVDYGCRIARRVITRTKKTHGEDAEAVSPEDFEAMERASAFAMSWHANGHRYGIPKQIDEWLAEGYDVLVNGSRAYLNEARRLYPGLLALCLAVKPDVLRQRLVARGRESLEEIEARLERNLAFARGLEGPVTILDSSTTVESTVRHLLDLLKVQSSLSDRLTPCGANPSAA